jgi:hypothetical protein
MRRILIPLACSMVWTLAFAQTEENLPPPPPVDVAEEGPVEPQITIIQEEDKVIYEYRSNEGQLYMVKVVPRKGRPYYLLDTDGDGQLDTEQYDPRRAAVQMWELLRW